MHSASICCTTSSHRHMQVQVLQQVSNMEIRQSPPEIGINTVNVLGLYDTVDLLGRSSSPFACHLVDFKQLLRKLRICACANSNRFPLCMPSRHWGTPLATLLIVDTDDLIECHSNQSGMRKTAGH